MVHDSNAGLGWRFPSFIVRVKVSAQQSDGLCWLSDVRSAMVNARGAAVRLVEVERRADLLLIVGATEWVERFIRQSRQAGDPTPIVVLDISAKSRTNVQILEAGADDCLACPFDPAELRARVLAVMRRLGNGLTRGHEIAADCETLRIRVRDVEARVSRKQFDIFMYLAEHRERWVHTDEIIATVSGTHHEPTTSLVRVQIHALRKAFGVERDCIRCDGRKSYMLSLIAGAQDRHDLRSASAE